MRALIAKEWGEHRWLIRVLMVLAPAVFLGSPPFYVAALAMFVILNYAFCPYEEQKLLRSFSGEFAAYKSTVRRWL